MNISNLLKNTKRTFRKRGSRLIALLLSIFFAHSSHAQTLTPVTSLGSSYSDAHSPTMTAIPGTNTLVSAYVTGEIAANYKRVEVASSTDDGSTWTDQVTLGPPSDYSTNSNWSMDQPQIMEDDDGNDVSIVVRCYDNTTYNGSYQPNGNGDGADNTLFTDCGIYYCHSTNGGASGSWSPWIRLDHEIGGTVTVDHPCIAFRRDYGLNEWNSRGWVNNVPGCITWEKRAFKVSLINGVKAIPLTNITNDIQTKVRMAFYLDGTVYQTSGGSYFSEINTASNPQRPSVAIAPDGGIWLAYYSCSLASEWSNDEADYYVQKGSVTLSGSPLTASVSFSTTNGNEYKLIGSELLPGSYDEYRGYFFSEESQQHPEFNVELAQGPQIQVAVSNIYQCDPTYTVGVAYTKAAKAHPAGTYNDNNASPDVNRPLVFWHAQIPFGALPGSATWIENDTLDHGPGATYEMHLLPQLQYVNFLDFTHEEWPQLDEGTPPEASYFVLSSIYATRCIGTTNMGGQTLDLAQCRTNFTFDNTFDEGLFERAETGCAGTGTIDLKYFGTQEAVCGQQGLIIGTGAFGTLQIHTAWHHLPLPSGGCDGDHMDENNGGAILALAYLDGYPYNEPSANPTVTGLPYYYFNFDGIGQPSTITPPSTYSSPTGTEGISDGLGDFSFDQFRPATGTGTIPYGEYWAHYLGTTKTDYGDLNTSDLRKIVMTEDVAHAVFEEGNTVYYSMGTPEVTHGQPPTNSNFRSWTQPVAIGGIPSQQSGITQTLPSIAVYEEDGEDVIRTAERTIGGNVNGLPPALHAAPDRFDGLSSIAVTWTELNSVPDQTHPTASSSRPYATIKMRVREFNTCTGEWHDWSPPYTLYESQPNVTYDPTGGCDGVSEPIPVSTVAPLAFPQPTSPTNPAWPNNKITGDNQFFTFQPTNLIGWVTTWSDDWGDANGVLLDGPLLNGNPQRAELRSKVLLRPEEGSGTIDNLNWGTYTADNPNNGLLYQPPGISTSNMLYNNPQGQTLCSDFITYLSSTSQENKAEDSIVAKEPIYNLDGHHPPPPGYGTNPRSANYQIDVAFSTSNGYYYDGGYSYGILTGSTQYGTSSNNYGQLLQPTNPLGTIYGSHAAPMTPSTVWEDLNDPDITVNSSGQQFMAWEQIGTTYATYFTTPGEYSSIVVANTYYEGSWLKNGIANIVTIFDEGIPTARTTWSWLRDPSIAGYPKTMSANTYDYGDIDLGTIQLLFWQHKDAAGNLVDKLRPWYYQEEQNSPGVPDPTGNAGWFEQGNLNQTGTNPQTSFSPFSQFNLSCMFGNDESSPPVGFSEQVGLGSYKLGVFDSIQDFAEYRSEACTNDSAQAKFVWGDAYVTEPGDTIPEQIKLAYNIDTAGWASHDEVRDSLFRTQPFTLNLGATVSYFRGSFINAADSLAAATSFDQKDSMRYYIEMVHSSGRVDTLERLVYAPGVRSFVTPSLIHTQPSLLQTDTVYLRLEGSIIGFSDADSMCQFANEINFGHYQSIVDSTLALKQANPFGAPSENGLQVMDVYPNPITQPGSNITVILTCPRGLVVSMTLVDAMGKILAPPSIEDGTGHWMTYSITAPETAGSYFIRISNGVDSKVLPISIIR